MGRDRLNTVADDLVAADIIATADHNDDFGAATQGWFDLFSNPAGALGVEAAGELALKLLAREFEENTFGHRLSITREALTCIYHAFKSGYYIGKYSSNTYNSVL